MPTSERTWYLPRVLVTQCEACPFCGADATKVTAVDEIAALSEVLSARVTCANGHEWHCSAQWQNS
jgi:hypothetical protein